MANKNAYSINDLHSFIDFHIVNEEIKRVLKAVINDYSDEIELATAGKYHHNYTGGLIDHTYGVASLCAKIVNQYDDVDISKDLLLAGAILHDIGKIYEYGEKFNSMIKHNVSSSLILEPYLKDFELSERDKRALHNIILTHMQSPYEENSKVAEVVTLEGIILRAADTIDAFVIGASKNLNSCSKGCFYECDVLPRDLYKPEI